MVIQYDNPISPLLADLFQDKSTFLVKYNLQLISWLRYVDEILAITNDVDNVLYSKNYPYDSLLKLKALCGTGNFLYNTHLKVHA